MRMVVILVMWPRCGENYPFRLHMIWFFWSLKSVDDGRTDDWACQYHKLTYEPKGAKKGGLI